MGGDRMGFFETYAATAGLGRFPLDQQFCVWLALHKKLKTSDPRYRGVCRRFVVKIVGVSLLLTLIMMLPGPLFLGDTISVGSEIALTVGGLVLYIPWVLVVSVRHQKWLNARVAEEIKKALRDGVEP